MREFSLDIDEALLTGIAPDKRSLRNTKFLSDAYNVKTSPFGLKEFEKFIDPFEGGASSTYPFPMLFDASFGKLLFFASSVQTVNDTLNPWQYSPLSFVDLSGVGASINSNGSWRFVDLKDSWYAFNGASVLLKDVSGRLRKVDDSYICVNDLKVNTGCYHRGRMVVAGFSPNNFWRQGWKNIFSDTIEDISEIIDIPFNEIGKNYILWSSIGGGDFPLWLLKPERALFGSLYTGGGDYDYDVERFDQSMFFERLIRNEFGYISTDYDEEILGLAPLGNKLIVFGDRAVTGLFAVNGEITTYGKKNLLSIGLASRNSYCFNREKQVCIFLGQKGQLWSVDSEFKLEKLGYENSLSSLLGGDILINESVDDGEYYITDGSKTFVWTQNGLSRVSQHPTSLHTIDGSLLGLYQDDQDDSVLIESETYDMGLRAIKTITSINLGVLNGGDVKVAIDYRYDTTSQFTRSPFVPINKEGGAVIRVSGVDFRIVVSGTNLSGFELDSISVRYQTSDKRQIRGAYAS